ncbi:hypothetical protein GLOTRDRAFT_139014 [Gloeophyllum trabeum ATCC 11539]|uniref:Uncharacterized protein n=1 Tax=Gloeophyllum trabeum (strain ATCC 11539 / FP-39264 / Madison 617) TaxID=670483 RepID=S7RJA4_GLOTA|nr:uncharacterized protein GLOTRDRAFT_139014 [Gloeophyllum trabeum ATCC 11539]EPQ54420.1 hypothetical protein GLOTRDRAFT_139014 [Gloeophyllum trabeum ATCC 11539]
MDQLPEEITSSIFTIACTDDGRTAKSLLLVSKKTKRIVAPIQWHSVSLSGQTEFCGFAAKVSKLSEYRPIYHLFISDRAASEAYHPWSRTNATTIEELHSREETERVRWRHAQNIILEHAAPTVQTLTFLALDPRNSARRVGDMFKRVYPNLRELTLRVPPLQPLFASEPIDLTAGPFVSVDSDKSHLLPRLQRLHVAGHFKKTTSASSRIKAISSGVTHLRLSGIFAYPFARELGAELFLRGVLQHDVLAENPTNPLPSPFLPLSMQCIVIQPTNPTYADDWGTDHGEETIALLKTLEDAAEDPTQLLYISPLPKSFYTYDQAKEDWLSRVNGGFGCWKISETEGSPEVEHESPEAEQDSEGGPLPSRLGGKSYLGSLINSLFGW